MKIAVMGTGGVGGYFGARLAASGEEVTFIARGVHLAAIRERGLKVLSESGDVTVHPAQATDDPAEVGPVDIVMFCVKLWDTESAGEAVRPMVGEGTGVISFQNGVDARDRLTAILGGEHVIGGVAGISARIAEPGVIRHVSTATWLEFGEFGEFGDPHSPRVDALLEACIRAGIETRVPDDVEAAIWRKFVFLTAMSAANCLARQAIGPIREDPVTRSMLETLIAEAAAVARGRGVAVAEDLEARIMGMIDTLAPEVKASMLGDLERGNRLEVPWLSGALGRLGREAGVATPYHDVACGALKLYAEGSV